MKVTYFFRPKMNGVHSIETLFGQILEKLPETIHAEKYVCTHKWKRIYSFLKARTHQSDVNHITGDINMLSLFLDPKRTVLTIHDIGHLERDLKGFKRKIFKYLWLTRPLKRLKYITTISEFTKEKILNEVPVPESKIKVIPNPAAIDFKWSPKIFDSECPTILQIGSGNNKNIDRLVEAIRDIRCQLILIRRPDDNLKKRLERLKIRYTWLYDISRAEVYKCYQQCDIVFFASEYEGFGVPILEANAVGRPVITSNISSMPYVAGESAYFVDPFNTDDIKKAVEILIKNKTKREWYIAMGKKNLERFSVEKIVAEYIELYQSIVSK